MKKLTFSFDLKKVWQMLLLAVLFVPCQKLMAQDADYLCFTAEENEAYFQLYKYGNPTNVTLEYSTNGGSSWTDYTFTVAEVSTYGPVIWLQNAGDKVYFRNKSNSVTNFSTSAENYYRFSINNNTNKNNKISVSGNVMSLVDKRCATTTIPNNYCFARLFESCNCITSAPKLPATELKEGCYYRMFTGCNNLTNAPTLPARTLKSYCYYEMFEGCTSLSHVEVGFTEWVPSGTTDALRWWMQDVSQTGTFECPKDLDTSSRSYYIPDGWTISQYMPDYLCFTTEKAASIRLEKQGSPTEVTIEYSKNGMEWNTLTLDKYVEFQSGETLYLRNASETVTEFSKRYNNYYHFRLSSSDDSNRISASGNIMSLVDKSCNTKTIPCNYCFYELFSGNRNLTSAPKLPATTLAIECYENMFEDCTGLTEAPALPATSLSYACYSNMFSGCTGLVNAPELAATTLAEGCYRSMFQGCTGLTVAPELPATTLVRGCYENMFGDCTGLTEAPELPAPTLVEKCYYGMFDNCSNLRKVSVSFKEWFKLDENGATAGWLGDVAEEGEFICPPGLPKLTGSSSYIPENWTVKHPYLCFTANTTSSSRVSLSKVGSPADVALEYSKDASVWQPYTFGTEISLSPGASVYFRNPSRTPIGFSTSSANYYHFSVEGDVAASGNIMTLVEKTGSITEMPDDYISLFYGLFSGCTGLTAAPELPATKLARKCYREMFSGCSNLRSVPELPATTLANYCYNGMFSGCTSLTSAPVLPVTTLANYCYEEMFKDCSSLNFIKVGFTKWHENATRDWLSGVAAKGVFEAPVELDKTKTGTSNIPAGWAQTLYHPKSEPTFRTVGYSQDCWEVPGTGKYYSDSLCTQELTNARLLRYAKLRSNPITYLEEGGSSAENKTYEGVPFNWVAGGPFESGKGLEGTKRRVEFTVIGTDVADARLKLYSSVAFTCSFYIRIFVNGTEKHKETYGNSDPENFEERKSKAYIDAYPLEGLKTGDVVCLEVEKHSDGLGGWSYFDACLEYTSSNGGGINITVRADEKHKVYGTTQDPELTYSVLKSGEAADINLSGINLIREKGEELGEYAIHISQDEGANQEYYITFVDGKFRILDVEHRTITAPEYTTTGYSQECWEETATGKFYTYDINMQELNPAQVITYKKLISNPVTANNRFTLKEDATYDGVQFNWAAETTYGSLDTGTRYVEFTVFGTDVDNARLKWRKTHSDARYGIFNITVYVNGKQVYRIQNYGGADLFAVPLQGLKTGDIVRFEVQETSQQWAGSPTITACLEYTSSNGGFNSAITITADDKYKHIGQSDPELTWKITNGALMEGDELTDINIWREEGEDAGRYPIHVSQKEGANSKYYIRFVDGTFTVNEVVHHEVTEPTHRTIGYSRECWEDMLTGKFYSDAECTQELSSAEIVTYEKLISNPVTPNNRFTLKEDATYDGVQFNWAAETIYNNYDKETRSVEFTVFGTDVANARLKWTKTSAAYQYGKFTITVYVNGEQKYSVNQNNGASLGGLFAVPLPDLQFGDNVKFEVQKPKNSEWAGSVTIAACLEYTSSNKCGIVIKADDIQKQKGDGDPELTWKITKGALMEGDELTDINIWREEGEDAGRYPIHVSQKEGANPKYGITFLDGTFTVNEVVHHEVTEPTHRTIGYSKECWEDIATGKFYSDAECTQELSSAETVTYKRLISNPVTTNSGFTLKDVEYNGVQFNWAAETIYYNTSDTGTRSVEFTVFGTDVDNARVKWTKKYNDALYGRFTISIYVNGVSVYSVNQDNRESLGGLFAVPLPDLKSGDKVKFEVKKPNMAQWDGSPMIAACLEYTSSNGGKGVGKYNYNVVVKAVDKQKFIGETDPELTYTVYPENIELSGISLTRDEGEELGEYVIHITEDEGANPGYDITLAEGKFTISKSPITIKADDKVKHVGDAGPELTWSVKGKLIEGHDLTDIIISREKGEEAGTYSIYASQANGANPYYDITFEDGTLVIADTDLPIYHGAAEPTYRTIGYTQNCWENPATRDIYSDVLFEHELNPAEIVTYKKLISSPVTADSGFTLKDVEYNGVQFNWAAETSYKTTSAQYSETGTRSVEFTVYGTDVDNARVKWNKNNGTYQYGKFTITVYVNGTQVYSINQDDNKSLSGFFAVPLQGLKTGDVVKFEVQKPMKSDWTGNVTIAACLEYTSSNGGAGVILTADDKLKNKGDDDPELTWSITGTLDEGDELTDIKIWREEGEEIGSYTIHVSQEEGANPKYNITFVEGTFRISDIIHHDVTEPTYETVGYLQECWEDRTLGKYYSDAACTKELSPAQVVTYAKIISDPVTANNGFTLKDLTYSGIQFDWAAETTYTTWSSTIRYVEFTVFGTDVDNARLKWRKTYSDARYGTFDITVYVNGKQVYRIQNYGGTDLFAVPLQGLKTGDIVRFEVEETSQQWAGSPTITACLEYTSSNGGLNGMLITANQDPDHKQNYYSTFWSSTAAYQVPEGVTAYTGKVEDSTSEPNTSVLKLTAIEDGIIPASQGVILRMTTEDNSATKQQIALAKTTATGTWSDTNALTGTDVATTLGANQYALSLGQHGVGFYLWEGKEIGAHKAYLTLPSSSGAKAFIFQFDDAPTGIESLTPALSEGEGAAYNLNGVRVDDSYKGIVIKNGKKIYQK